MNDSATSLRPRPGETAEDTVARVVEAVTRNPRFESTCEWFTLCDRPAVGTVAHPILGSVPACQHCVDKLDLELE